MNIINADVYKDWFNDEIVEFIQSVVELNTNKYLVVLNEEDEFGAMFIYRPKSNNFIGILYTYTINGNKNFYLHMDKSTPENIIFSYDLDDVLTVTQQGTIIGEEIKFRII